MSDLSKYRGDVWYEEWRRGLPEGAISDDRIDDAYHYGRSPESLVSEEANRRESSRQQREAEQWAEQEREREYYESQQEED